ncbi:MAG: OmpA family protein [Bacteroidia bacterium]|nr:OmpA family protein [Bacteroidia bacterium]MDW8159030.1 OmpA family protein [Bacteroidia bacterium]
MAQPYEKPVLIRVVQKINFIQKKDTVLHYHPSQLLEWLTADSGNYFFSSLETPYYFWDTINFSINHIPLDTIITIPLTLRKKSIDYCLVQYQRDELLTENHIYLKQYQMHKEGEWSLVDSIPLVASDSSLKVFFPSWHKPYRLALYIQHTQKWETFFTHPLLEKNCIVQIPSWESLVPESTKIILQVVDKKDQSYIPESLVQVYKKSNNSEWELIFSNKVDTVLKGTIMLENWKGGQNYRIQVSAPKYLYVDTVIFFSNTRRQVHKIELEKFILEHKYLLRYVYFPLDSWQITASAELILENLVILLKANPLLKIHLIAHTDTRGEATYNDFLSLKRAQTCQDYLIRRGIAKERIKIEGKGAKVPLIREEKNEEDFQKNRRLEFILYN